MENEIAYFYKLQISKEHLGPPRYPRLTSKRRDLTTFNH